MASMPPITGIRVGIDHAGMSSGLDVPFAGHEYIKLDFSNGSELTLEAGPSGTAGTGDLVEMNYGSSSPYEVWLSTANVNNTGYSILNAYDNYAVNTQDDPIAYSPDTGDGYNSNSFISGLLEAAGFSDSSVSDISDTLGSESGLNPVGSDAGAGIVPFFSDLGNESGGGSGTKDENAY